MMFIIEVNIFDITLHRHVNMYFQFLVYLGLFASIASSLLQLQYTQKKEINAADKS